MMDKIDIGKETRMETGGDVVAVPENNSIEIVRKDSLPPSPVGTPKTLELRKHGYLALARGLGSGMYESPTGLQSQASAAFDFMTRQSRDQFAAAVAEMGDDIRGFRQSSIDTEPQTLPLIGVRRAKDGAVEIIKSFDEEEALHLFLKEDFMVGCWWRNTIAVVKSGSIYLCRSL